jgi:hypothetical protein
MDETPIDTAFLASEARPDDNGLYMRLLERIMDAELFLLLSEEPDRDKLDPHVFELEEGRFLLAFDQGERLAEFLDAPAPYVALPGRRLVEMMAGQDIGLALNLGVAPSEMLLPSDAIGWMALQGEEGAPREAEARVKTISMPRHLPSGLIAAIDPKLAAMSQVIREAHLVDVKFSDETAALLLALVDVPEYARRHVATAIGEAVRFSGTEHARLDVTFVERGSPMLAQIAAVSIRIDLPGHDGEHGADVGPSGPSAPGADPGRPPILRRW